MYTAIPFTAQIKTSDFLFLSFVFHLVNFSFIFLFEASDVFLVVEV